MECRFCLEPGTLDDRKNPLLTPCACKGSAGYVHKTCLWHWRQTDVRDNQDIKCPVCLSHYDTNIVKMYKREIIPLYKNIPVIQFLHNPILTVVWMNYLYLWYLTLFPSYKLAAGSCPNVANYTNYTNYICPMEQVIVYDMSSPYIVLNNILLGLHLVACLRLFTDVYDGLRYARTASKFWPIVAIHMYIFLHMKDMSLLGGFAHALIIPQYYIKHQEVLRIMNAQF